MSKIPIKVIVTALTGLLVCMMFTTVVNDLSDDRLSMNVEYVEEEAKNIKRETSAIDEEQSDSDPTPVTSFGDGSDANGPGISRGGNLEWVYTTEEGGQVSTPALVDLDSDGFLEVVFVSEGNEITALNHDGSRRWVNTNYVIETASYFKEEMNLDFWPIDLFSSITPANIDRDKRPEIILGAYNGLVFLNHDGEPKYSQAHTGRFYFSTPVVCDLEGDYSNIDMDANKLARYKDLEILTGADDTAPKAYLEAWHATGGDIFDMNVVEHGESAFVLGIAVGDLDGSMDDDIYYENEEAAMEIVFSTHDKGMRIFEQTGDLYSSAHGHNHPVYDEDTSFTIGGHLSYATAAVGNFSKKLNPQAPEMYEIIIGKGGWHGGNAPYFPVEDGLYAYDMYGNEHWHVLTDTIIVSSPAVGDVQTEDRDEDKKHLAEYEIFVGNSYEGEFYCIDADDGSTIWSWEIDGAKTEDNRVISSPAIININSDDELEVVVGSDNGKIYCFDGDPSDGSNDGEEYSEYSGEGGEKFDLLWVFDTHENTNYVESTGPIGISSPVVADIDKDGVLEVVIGDSRGNVWCIEAGGTASRGQQDWPMFHYDLNNSGFYDPKVQYGVDINMYNDHGPFPSKYRYIDPGETTTFNLAVVNTGRGLSYEDFDNIYIESYYVTENVNGGWKYSLEGNDLLEHDGLNYVKLAMQESTVVQLNVTAPWEAELGDYIMIRVKVNSSMDYNAVDTIELTVILRIKVDFNLEFNWLPLADPLSPFFNKKLDVIMPGEEKVYTITLQNIGYVNDTYRVWVEDQQPGWKYSWVSGTADDATELTVDLDSALFKQYGAENATELQLRVRVPNDEIGGEVSYVSIKGVSVLSENEQEKVPPVISIVERKDTMLVEIGDVPRLHITCDDNQKYLMPGERGKFKVHVKNNGNVDYTVTLSHSEPNLGWSVSMPVSVDVRSGEQRLVEVFLTAPAEEYPVKAGTHEMVSIEGTVDTREGMLSSSIGIVGILSQVRHMNVTVTPAVNTTVPGGIVTYKALIENMGNGDTEIFMNPYSLALGWKLTFPDECKLILQWRETVSVTFEIHVSNSALAGTITNVLNISDSGNVNIVHANVKTVVMQTYDLNIGAYSEASDQYTAKTTQYITPGSSTLYDLRVTNAGNGPDTAAFSLYLYKYHKSAPGGGISEVSVNSDSSETMIADAIASGGVKWYVSSVQSSPGAFSTEPVYWDFKQEIPVDPSAEIRYQPQEPATYATHLTLSLLPGQSAWLQITIDYPADELMDPMYFEASVVTLGEDMDLDDNFASLNLEVKYPDLAFDKTLGGSGLNIVGQFNEDNPQLNIQIKVRNIGEMPAVDIVIALHVDGQFLDSRTVMRLINSSADGTKDILISFAWKPVGGEHKIEVRLDPDNSVIELNEQNNVVNKKIDIDGPTIVDSFLNPTKSTCSMVLIILSAIVITITAFIIRKQRKQVKQ